MPSPLVYDWCSMVSSSNPATRRHMHPVTFDPATGGGWRAWGQWRAGVIARARQQAPSLRIKPCIHMRTGCEIAGQFEMDSPNQARLYPLIGDTGMFLRALDQIVQAAGQKATLYCGAPDISGDPSWEWNNNEGDIAKSGLVDEYVIDGTALTEGHPEDDGTLVPHSDIVALFDGIRKLGLRAFCEAWPVAHNWPLASYGVCCSDVVYARQISSRPSAFDPKVKPWALPREKVGDALLLCITLGRDTLADVRAWTALHPRNTVAVDLQGWMARNRNVAEIEASITPHHTDS